MMNTPLSEEVLISNVVNGDLEAFNQLVLQYQDIAYRYAYAILGDPDNAEDITQESFIKAFQKIRSFRGGSFRAWLLKIVTNTSYDQLRKKKMHPVLPLFPEGPEGEEIESPKWLGDPAPSIEAMVQSREEMLRVYQILDELPAVFRSIITLIDIHELDYAEAAEVMNIPLGTVKSRLARARSMTIDKLQASTFSLSWQANCTAGLVLFPGQSAS